MGHKSFRGISTILRYGTAALAVGFICAACARNTMRAVSIADARNALPAGCVPMYIIDGIVQADTLAVQLLPDSVITEVDIIHGSGMAHCPFIVVSTNRK